MKNIWQMWKIVSFLQKHKKQLAIKLAWEKAQSEKNKLVLKRLRERVTDVSNEIGESLSEDNVMKLADEVLEDHKDTANHFAFNTLHSYHKEALVDRDALIELYIETKHPSVCLSYNNCSLEEKLHHIEMNDMRIEVNSVIESCLDPVNAYLKGQNDENKAVYLTAKGKSFAGFDGLLKAEIIEFGVLSSVLVTAVVAGFPLVIKITSYISPWW